MTEQELMHFGVPGMKWGHRKNPEVAAARSAYKSAKKDLRSAGKNYRKTVGITGLKVSGINGISKEQKARQKVYNADMKRIDAKAKYKASKAKTAEKAAKAEFKTYRKEMQKSGLVGSAADKYNDGRSTRMYNHLKATKGKAYADKVQKKVQNVAVTEFCVASSVAIGSVAVQAYLNRR